MIELLEGVPGTGKTCYAIGERVIPWVRAGKRTYICMDNFSLPLWSVFLGIPLETLEKQVTVLSREEALRMHEIVQPNSKVFLDEVQNYFRSRTKVNPALLSWLETHRHYGIDLLYTCQNYKQCTSPLTRLVEATWKFRRMDFIGLSGRYFAKLRGEVEDTEIIRTVTGKFDPRVYRFYSSYAASGVKEERQYGSVWRSPKMVAAVLFLVVGLGVIFGPSFFGQGSGRASFSPASLLVGKSEKGGAQISGASVIVPPVPGQGVHFSPLGSGEANSTLLPAKPVCLVGSWRVEDGPWKFLTSLGRSYTVEELTSVSGSPVRSEESGGVVRVLGQGVQSAPCNSLTEGG